VNVLTIADVTMVMVVACPVPLTLNYAVDGGPSPSLPPERAAAARISEVVGKRFVRARNMRISTGTS